MLQVHMMDALLLYFKFQNVYISFDCAFFIK